MLSTALLLITMPFAAAGDRLLVLDIANASAADVKVLKAAAGLGGWLEMGDRLVLLDTAVARSSLPAPVLSSVDDVDPGRLVLRARGCSEHGAPAGRLVTQGGRYELRLLATGEAMPASASAQSGDGHDGSWYPVKRNSVIARQFRLDAAPKGLMPDPVVQAVVEAVDADRWFADVETLASWDRSSLGGASLADARDWIGTQFSAMGLEVEMPEFTIPTSGGPITRNNVVGSWRGTAEPDRWVIVGAHYDSRNASSTSTTGTPGADDNASGCAGVVELARALLPTRPRRSFLFVCYAGEEQGLRGSTAHVQALTQTGDLTRVEAVLIMDMIGYSADANLQALYESSDDYPEYLQRFGIAAQRYVPALDVLISTHPFGSDHVPYLDAGVQALLAIEADWDDYPHYHLSTDTPANIGPEARAMGGAILRTNAAVLAEIGGAGSGFADDFESPVAGTSR